MKIFTRKILKNCMRCSKIALFVLLLIKQIYKFIPGETLDCFSFSPEYFDGQKKNNILIKKFFFRKFWIAIRNWMNKK